MEVNQAKRGRKSILGRRNSTCKGQEARRSFAYSRGKKKADVVGARRMREGVEGNEFNRLTRAGLCRVMQAIARSLRVILRAWRATGGLEGGKKQDAI